MSLTRLLFRYAVPAWWIVAVACDDPLALRPAAIENIIDTVAVNALRGTPIGAPSGFDVAQRVPANTERGDPFDFSFDIDPDGRALVYPPGALGLGRDAGLQVIDRAFDRVEEAPIDGYSQDTAVVVEVGSVFVVRSRPFLGSGIGDDCPFFIGALPRYGKFQVLEIDAGSRVLNLEALINVNCGYRGLRPGLPTN